MVYEDMRWMDCVSCLLRGKLVLGREGEIDGSIDDSALGKEVAG